MGRLFWTFPDGLPGAGLLLIRGAIAAALLARATAECEGHFARCAVEGASALLLLVGLGTPFAGGLVAVLEAWRAIAPAGELLSHGLLAVLGLSAALIGPGAASLDAWIFGWRRIDVRAPRLERGGGRHQ